MAKEASAEATRAQEAAGVRVAELTAELEACRASYDDRLNVLTAQLTQLDQRVANADRENGLLHSQVHAHASTCAHAAHMRTCAHAHSMRVRTS